MCNDLTLKPLVQHFYTLILHVTPTILHVNVEHPLYDTGQVSLGILSKILGIPVSTENHHDKRIPGLGRGYQGRNTVGRGYPVWEGDTMSEKGIPCLRRGYHV